MAIYAINEVLAQRQGDLSSNAVRNYLRLLQLLSNDPKDGQVTALFAVMNYLGISPDQPAVVIFQVGNDIDSGAYLNKIAVRQDTSKKGEYVNWEARLDYSSQLDQLPDNPLLRPTIITGGFQMYQKPLVLDLQNNWVVNAANQFIEDAEIDDARPHVTMTRNEVSYNWSFFAANLVNFVNNDFFYGALPGQVKCCNVGGNGPITENGVTYYSVTYEFQFRYEGWQPRLLNRGRKNKDGTPCVDQWGNEMDEAAFLDKNGTQLPWPVQLNAINTINVQGYLTTAFSAYGLP